MTARVMVFASVNPGDEAAFEKAYGEVTDKVRGTRGHLRDELLRRGDQPGHYVLLSEWESVDAFTTWEDDPIHRRLTTPMRPYWSGRVERVLFDVVAKGAARADGGAS